MTDSDTSERNDNSRHRAVVVVLLVAVSLLLGVLWRANQRTTPSPSAAAGIAESTPLDGNEEAARVAYAKSLRQTTLASQQDGTVEVGPGVVFAVIGQDEAGYDVIDVCNREGWVSAAEVEAGYVPTNRIPGTLADSVFVIDPGHGFPDQGALGPTGIPENQLNLQVAGRLAELLSAPRDVDWATGRVTAGSSVPAAASTVLTRPVDGPNNGDYEVGLKFRAELANSADATALISIHHNSAPLEHRSLPGSEVYVSAHDSESARLGGLIVDELRRGLARFGDDWMGGNGDGLRARVDDQGNDYYAVIRESNVPSVIVEGAYISHNTEEKLAATDAFQQAYAEGIYRALVRFVSFEESPMPAPEPVTIASDGSSRSMDDCQVPLSP